MKKVLTIALLVAAFMTFTTGIAFAQDTTPTPITGTVELVEVVLPPDPTTGETIVAVTILDETTGTTQTVNISLETAELLGLVTVDDATGEVTINEVTDPITIEPTDILPETGVVEEETEAEHPVGSALGEFFGELLGVDYDVIMAQKEEGVGFGVIAQALWLTNQIGGGTEEFEALLEAKQSGDYSDIVLADGSTPDNWGDVVKSLKKGENLGSIMSGKADDTTEDADTTKSNGKSNGKGNNSDTTTQDDTNGNGKDKDKGNNGKGNSGDKGNNGGGNGKGKP